MRDYQIDWDKIINTILLIVTMGVLVVAVIGAIGAIKNNSNYIWCQSNYIYETVPEQVNLYAGNNDFQLSGEWSIFGGRVDTEDVVFYWVNENGVLSKHNAPMSQSTFIEDGKNQLLIFYPICWEFPEHKIFSSRIKYEFHVPQNSVANMYGFQ